MNILKNPEEGESFFVLSVPVSRLNKLMLLRQSEERAARARRGDLTATT